MKLKQPISRLSLLLSGGLAAALGLGVLLGWHTHNLTLVQVLPGFVPMQYNTALGFLLCGLGLLSAAYQRPWWATVCGGVVGVIGILTLSEYIFRVGLGIDQLLMEHYIFVKTSHPGRMAPNTALCFSLAGAALLVVGRPGLSRHRPLLLGLLGSLISALGVVAVSGYLSGIEAAYGWGHLTRMALHTATGFAVLGGGIIVFAWRVEKQGATQAIRWLPWPVGIGVATVAVSLWQALSARERGFGPEADSFLPEVTLAAGLLLAGLLALSLFLAQTARFRAQLVERANRELAHEITERQQSREELSRLFTLSLDLLCVAGFDGYFKRLNPAWEKTLGFTTEELLARPYLEFIHPHDQKATLAEAEKIASGVSTLSFENRYHCKDGSYRWFSWTAYPIPDEQLIYGAARDVTAHKQAEAELAAAVKELEAFTYSVSHDLRAPLRHVDGFSRLLLDDYSRELPEPARRYLLRVREGSQQMGRLIDDLLNLSRIGRQELNRQVTGLNSLLEEVLADLRPETEGRRIEWRVTALPFLDCDPALMKHVIANLLSNALKYTRPRECAVIEIGQIEQDGQPVIFVRDNGVGFSMKYADKLFGVFQRLHRPEDFEGTGVGLATVQRILHKHGGRIWAQAELDKGAAFYFTVGQQENPQAENLLPAVTREAR